ncbi:hypothetical protein [Acinetobacter sp.]|uniref:hypothetical protein n=1 Tax=Acinetobacter sp. TaxID=472 RepID=UPI0035AF5E96
MKKQILILALLLAPAGKFAHAAADPQLESVIQSVANGFYTRDAQKVQKFIHPQQGYIYWYRIGIPTISIFPVKMQPIRTFGFSMRRMPLKNSFNPLNCQQWNVICGINPAGTTSSIPIKSLFLS